MANGVTGGLGGMELVTRSEGHQVKHLEGRGGLPGPQGVGLEVVIASKGQ